ncbi:MAG: YbaY family lipoprotein [Candidatus Promineofilum sp.]|nr:YbaY family lipoprotein [Promineifilum sp.]
MRTHGNLVKMALLALLLVALAACGAAQPGAENVEIADSAGTGTVTGTVTYLDRSALPDNAVIDVELVDASRADAAATVLAAQSITAGGAQVPFPFELNYDPAQINPGALVLVQARITIDGQLRYISQTAIPVITNGAPTADVEVLVSPVVGQTGEGVLSGTVAYLERIALDPTAVIEVELQDVSSGVPAVLATTQVNAEGRQPPIPFELPYDAAQIDPAGTYLLYGRILVNGAIAFASATGVPVLTGGAATSNVELIVNTVSAPVEGGGTIMGTVTTPRPPAALPAGAVLQVELREPMLADAPAAANIEVPLDGLNFPVSFELPYDPAIIAADRTYAVAARVLLGNQLLYATLAPIPVLTQNAPASAIVVPVGEVPDPTGGVLRFTATGDATATWPADSTAYLNVEIREPMLADAPALAFTYIPLAGLTLPVGWEIGYPTANIDPNKAYVLDARIIDNNTLTYAATAPLPVLTQGAPTNDVSIALAAQGTGGTGGNEGLITGVITTDAPVTLDPAATWFIDLREAGSTGDPIVTISATLEGQQFPIPFEVPYVPANIDPAKSYVVGARILLGDQVLFASAEGVPVITQGAPTADVTVSIPPAQ